MTRKVQMRATALVALPGALAVLALAALPASAQSNCQWYGATALKQQQQNERLKCGFTGPEWHSDMARHMAWCGQERPEAWKTSAQKRDQMLATCAAKAK